jgi:TolB protein
MQTTMRMAAVSRNALYAVAILALAVLLAFAVFIVGQQPRLPSPLGLAANGLIADDSHGQISLVTQAGQTVRWLTDSSTVALAPVFSPDGRTVAYWSIPRPTDLPTSATTRDQRARLYKTPATLMVQSADGGKPKPIVSNVMLYDTTVQWSHGSDALVYTETFATDTHSNVMIVSADGTPLGTIELADTPVWSPDDKLIAVRKPNQGIDVANRDGSNPHALIHTYGLDEAFSWPSWSPDGEKLAFFVGDQPGYTVHTISAEGGDMQLIADVVNGAQALLPRYSPDGAKIAYLRTPPGGGANLVVANADGSEALQFDYDVWARYEGFSPDGNYLIGYEGDPDLTGVVLINTTSGSVTRVPSSGSGSASWQRLAP